jgi:unsaturated chondroitin disaccharide hydrolase
MSEQLQWLETAWQDVTRKLEKTSKRIGANFPHASVNGSYELADPHWWTAGFWPGLLWLIYRDTKDESLRKLAEECEEKLDAVQNDYYRLDHDMGFMWTLTSVSRYQIIGDENSKRRALLAANLLMGRFNVNGNFIRAWNPWREGEDNSGVAIIDCLMNLPLLYWASNETGDPRFKAVASKHAETVLNHFIRDDGAVHHIISFDPESGEFVEPLGGQGFAPYSAWSRGTAWAVYGLALCYHYTGEGKFLEYAKRTAHFFLAHLPEDLAAPWDFRLPHDVPSPRDTSASSIAACGLLLIAEKVTTPEAPVYRMAGENILKSLYENYGDWNGQEEGLILEGTSHFPEGKYTKNPLIYGDYYFVEGLAKMKGQKGLFQ